VEYSSHSGVKDVVVGYTGGKQAKPTYRSIKDHSEGVRIRFDPSVLTYEDILISFFNQLGGSQFNPAYSCQYRSAIFVHNEEQREIAKSLIQGMEAQTNRKVLTPIEDAGDFYRAEEYHQKYVEKQRMLSRF
jgi:peptide-methionine (S)-S-oxide reductase